jgi:peptidoglycan/xylan/chitin deacetylase (PgdA/CDA1 family)
MRSAWEMIQQEKELAELFSKQEEYNPKTLDKHGRFTYLNSRDSFPLEPSVSQYLAEKGYLFNYPGNAKFAVCLTHDVDDIYPPWSHIARSSLCSALRLNVGQILDQISWKFGRCQSSPYRNFQKIMDIEKQYDATSTFYFLATDIDPIRYRYAIEDLKGELQNITKRGWDIGLHTGYYSYNNLKDVISEKTRLERVLGREIIGCRNHYLRFKVPETWEILSDAGFKYDSTLGYSDRNGFRNGMCHPFQPINLLTQKPINILEFPLNLMDTIYADHQGLNLKIDKIFESIKSMIDATERCQGVMTILWHNSTFGNMYFEKLAKLYESILKYCKEKNAWLTSADKIYGICEHTL